MTNVRVDRRVCSRARFDKINEELPLSGGTLPMMLMLEVQNQAAVVMYG